MCGGIHAGIVDVLPGAYFRGGGVPDLVLRHPVPGVPEEGWNWPAIHQRLYTWRERPLVRS